MADGSVFVFKNILEWFIRSLPTISQSIIPLLNNYHNGKLLPWTIKVLVYAASVVWFVVKNIILTEWSFASKVLRITGFWVPAWNCSNNGIRKDKLLFWAHVNSAFKKYDLFKLGGAGRGLLCSESSRRITIIVYQTGQINTVQVELASFVHLYKFQKLFQFLSQKNVSNLVYGQTSPNLCEGTLSEIYHF